MNWTGALAVYFILWWVVLFAVLPWGAHSPHELGEESEPGHAVSAPKKPRILLKFLATTIISGLIFGAVHLAIQTGLLNVEGIPFLSSQ